jgi:geranylgeranylglycerol-phosphate geranylgeranyltransferase
MTFLYTLYAAVFLIVPMTESATYINKMTEAIRLTRPQNIPATISLGLAGATIMNPSLSLRELVIPCIQSTLIMSNSMVLNDIYDIELDRVNSPERPLIKGTITKKEAIGFSLLLTGITEVVNILYLPRHLRWILRGALVYVHLYTPILKRIPVIKNIACASLVAFSVVFSGLSASTYVPFFENPRRGILYVVANAIFGGSWTNEVLLDMRDVAGDKANGIRTLTTLYVNMMINMVRLAQLGMNPFLYMGIMAPQFYMLYKILYNRFSNASIQSYLNHTTKTMMVILIIFSRSVF